MKKIICTHMLPCICATLIIHHAACQSIVNSEGSNINTRDSAITEYNTALPVNTTTDYRNTIHIKAVRNFIRDYKDAKNVSWLRTKDDCYVARFISDSVQTMAVYNQKGSLNYSLKRYAENKMPTDVRKMIKSIYFDYIIMEISEIRLESERENAIYNVLITYGNNFKILQICNREMEIVADFTKS